MAGEARKSENFAVKRVFRNEKDPFESHFLKLKKTSATQPKKIVAALVDRSVDFPFWFLGVLAAFSMLGFWKKGPTRT